MNNYFIKKNYHIITFIFLYFSIIFGFILGENTTLGPENDFNHALKQVFLFEKNFLHTFLNYDILEFHTRISPIFIMIIFFFKKIFIDIDLVRFIILNFLILNQIYFYKCLKLFFFRNFRVDKKYLFFLSCIIFLSPSFRSNIIWPESAMFGLLFFLISVYYFLKFKINLGINYVYLNIFFLALASYIRPSFAVFSIFFFIYYLLNLKDIKKIIQIIFFNLTLAVPAFYYLFVLDIFFITSGVSGNELNFNYLNKLSVIMSIISFHILPVIFSKLDLFRNFFKKDNLFVILITLLISIVSIYYFDYELVNTGGGIFLHFSHFIDQNDLIFLFFLPLLIFFVIKLVSIDYKHNLILLFSLIILTPQFSVYHKYYDPLVLILCFTLFKFDINKQYFKIRNMIFLYLFYLSYYLITFINKNIFNI